MDVPTTSESERQVAAEKAAQPGLRVSTLVCLLGALVLFLTAVILVSRSHTYEISKNLDFVKIYNYKKSAPDKNEAFDKVKAYAASPSGAWVNDVADAAGCRDMVNYWWPTAGFASNSTPITATCDFRVNLQLGPMEEQLQVKDVTTIVTTGCAARAGTYTIVFTLPAGNTGTIAPVSGSAPQVTIAAGTGAISLVNAATVIGYGFKTFSGNFRTCMVKRKELAGVMHDATQCSNGFSSPLCTCVRAFTARVLSWQARLSGKSASGLALGDAFSKGVQRCVELRRAHDVREENAEVYARSSALLVFTVALLLNCLLNVFESFEALTSTTWYALFFVGYFLAVLFTGLLDNKGSGFAEFQTVLAMTLPAFVVHGGYTVMLHAYSSARAGPSELPFLHPVTFDIMLCALSLFTLVERGVVQTEYLVAETLKCHVVGAAYIAVVWYHCYGKRREALESEFVQQAYLILYVVAILASLSSLVTPYASTSCFEIHWLMPGVLTYVAFMNPGWAVHLRMAAKLNVPYSTAVYNFNAVASLLIGFIGAVLLSSFLSEYFQIYGAKNFAWPEGGDSLSYAATRGLILPLPESTLSRISLPA